MKYSFVNSIFPQSILISRNTAHRLCACYTCLAPFFVMQFTNCSALETNSSGFSLSWLICAERGKWGGGGGWTAHYCPALAAADWSLCSLDGGSGDGVPDLLHSAGLSHTPPARPERVCACVCGIRGQGQPIPLQTITSHRVKHIPTPLNLQFVRWSDVGTEEEEGGVGSGPDEAPCPDEGKPVLHYYMTSYYTCRETLIPAHAELNGLFIRVRDVCVVVCCCGLCVVCVLLLCVVWFVCCCCCCCVLLCVVNAAGRMQWFRGGTFTSRRRSVLLRELIDSSQLVRLIICIHHYTDYIHIIESTCWHVWCIHHIAQSSSFTTDTYCCITSVIILN